MLSPRVCVVTHGPGPLMELVKAQLFSAVFYAMEQAQAIDSDDAAAAVTTAAAAAAAAVFME